MEGLPSMTSPINTHVQGGIVCEMKVASHAMDEKIPDSIVRYIKGSHHYKSMFATK
jgi:hypothetical protein